MNQSLTFHGHIFCGLFYCYTLYTMLLTHIISSIIGIIGSYLSSIPLIREICIKHTATLHKKIIYWGKVMTLLALTGVSITGTQLFLAKPEEFLNTGRFPSNMTIMAILIVVELSFVWAKSMHNVTISRTISVFSWTWVFIIAMIEPSYSYITLTTSYAVILLVIISIVYRKVSRFNQQILL